MYKDSIIHYNYYDKSGIQDQKNHLKQNNIKTTYNKSFKLKLTVIKLEHVPLIKKLTSYSQP